MRRWVIGGHLVLAACGGGNTASPHPDAAVDAAPDAAPDAVPSRCDVTRPFGTPTDVMSVNTIGSEQTAVMTADGLTMYVSADATGGPDVFRFTRAQPSGAFTAAGAVAGVNGP